MVVLDDAQLTGLALAAGRGDRVAETAFIRSTHREVRRYLTRLAGPADAEDLTQETFIRALRSVPRFAARGRARTWLLSIARRVAVDHIRAATSRPRIAWSDDWQAVAERATEPNVPDVADRVALILAVRELPRDRREAFVLTQLLGLDYAEAARVCGCPIGTIRSRVARARQDLLAAG